jgi:hypothetical protein
MKKNKKTVAQAKLDVCGKMIEHYSMALNEEKKKVGMLIEAVGIEKFGEIGSTVLVKEWSGEKKRGTITKFVKLPWCNTVCALIELSDSSFRSVRTVQIRNPEDLEKIVEKSAVLSNVLSSDNVVSH